MFPGPGADTQGTTRIPKPGVTAMMTSSSSSRPPTTAAPAVVGRVLLRSAGFLLCYLAAAWLVHGPLIMRQAVVWLPTGVAVAGLYILGRRYWSLIFLGTILDRLLEHYRLTWALPGAVGNTLEALVAVLVLQQLHFEPRFARLRDTVSLLFAAGLGAACSATAGRLGHYARPDDFQFWEGWLGWWRMNTLGILLVVPVVLTWWYMPRPVANRRALREALAIGGTSLFLVLLVVARSGDSDVGMIVSALALPVVMVAAVRFGVRGGTSAALAIVLLLVGWTVQGTGPFIAAPFVLRDLVLQTLVAALAVVPLVIGPVMAEREAALAARIGSEALRHAFQDVLPDIAYRIRGDGVYLDAYVPSGVTPLVPTVDVLGHTVEEIVPLGAERMRRAIAATLAGERTDPVEYEMLVNGRLRLRESRYVRLGPDEVLGVVRDITERTRAERLTAWQAAVLEQIASAQPTAQVLEAVVRGFEEWSDGGLCSILTLEGSGVHVAAAPSLPAAYNAAIEGVQIGAGVGSCGTAAYENRTVIVADIATDPLWVNFRDAALPHGLRACWSTPFRASSGEVLGTFAVYYREVRTPAPAELTFLERAGAVVGIAVERERREQALAEGREFLASISANVREGLYRTTPDRGLVYVNETFARMFGYDSVPELLRLRSTLFYADPARRLELGAVIDRRGFFTNEEVEFVRKDGSTFWALVSSTGVRGPDGRFSYYDGAISDITARRLLEDQLRQAQKMEAVGKLAGGVAHDFNNLLTAITGYAEALRAALPAGSTEAMDAAEIGHAADRAAGLTRQLLAFSRKQLLTPEVIDLREVVDQLGVMLRRLIGEDIRFVIQHAAGAATVRVDRSQTEQVILNLALNARDAMPQGGTLTIATSVVQVDAEFAGRHEGMEAGSYLSLAVQDTGIGMDDAIRTRAFDPFFTTKDPGKGTGLGLSTVYGIVRQSGGCVWIESHPGAGTAVRVYFPLVPAETAEIAAPHPAAPGPRLDRSTTILVVEDEAMVRDLVARSLRRDGYTVLVAEEGEEGLQLATAHPGTIDLLVTDVIMPRLSGPELAGRLLPLRPSMRVLYISGYTAEALDIRSALPAGTEYLQKPFTPSLLRERVRDLLAAERARA